MFGWSPARKCVGRNNREVALPNTRHSSTVGEHFRYTLRTIWGACRGLLLRATAAGYLGLPMKIIVTPSWEPLVVIHRGFTA
jgi:hypothetical protein